MMSDQKQASAGASHISVVRDPSGSAPHGYDPRGWKALLAKAMDTPFASVALMGIIGVVGISMGWIQYPSTASEAIQTQAVDNALPTMASKAFKDNKYDNANLVKEDKDPLAAMAGSLQEKLHQEQGDNQRPRQGREQLKEYYNQRIEEQTRQNQRTIAQMTQPAPLPAEQIAERRAREEALAQADALQSSAYHQLEQLEHAQPDAAQLYPPQGLDSDTDLSTHRGRQVAQVTLPGLEDYVDYQPAKNRPMNAFYGLRGERTEPELVEAQPVPNAIEAVVHGQAGDVTVTDGSTLKLRLLQDIQVDKYIVPRNALLTGECVIRGERVEVLLTSIRVENSIMPIQMRVYDIDGHAGIYVPAMALKQQVAQTGSQAVTGGSFNMPYMVSGGGNAAEMVVGQTAAQGINMALTGVRTMAAKKIAQQRATIRPNYHVYLKQE